jgi:serine/threonine protein kinase
MMDDSFPRRSPSPPPSPVDHAVLRSQAVPNDFASFTIFMSSMFAGSTYAVHYHSPSTVLLSPPIASGLSFSVSRYRIPHDRFAITIDQDTKLQKGADIIYKSPLLSVDRTTGRIREEARLKAIILEVRIPSHEPIRKHPNIVRLLGMAWDRDLHSSLMMPTLIVEYGDKGTLTEYVTNAGPLSLPCKLRLSLDIVEGLLALHRAGVVHADIKASNIVIFTSKGGVTAKILDFGSAVLLDEVPDEGTAELSVYSPLWNAPEYRERIPKIAIPAVDAYSFGLVFWQLMMESEDPFSHDVFRPPASSPHHSQAPNMQYIQELKLLEDDHFLEKAWEMLLSQSDWAASDQTSLRFVMENSVRRDWHKRDLHRIRKHLAVRVHGETSQSQADHKYAIDHDIFAIYSYEHARTEIASTTDRSIGDEQYRHVSL